MDQFEMNILEVIQKSSDISQREISEQVGISLGMVNLLIKKFLKVGWVKAEKMNGNKMKYLVTPTGILQLSKKTIDFISRSYHAVIKIRAHIKEEINTLYPPDEVIYILGGKDEIFQILVDVLLEEKRSWELIDEPQEGQRYVTWGRILEDEEGVDLLRDKVF